MTIDEFSVLFHIIQKFSVTNLRKDFDIPRFFDSYSSKLNGTRKKNIKNFFTLTKILEEEKIEIIQIGFQRQAERKISLKKYYEGTGEFTLFEWKGYNIKYDTIRKTKLYQQFKACKMNS